MRNLLALVGLLVVAFVAAGWYLGWYKIGEQTDSQGHPQLQIQVNPAQIKTDLEQGKQKLLDAAEKAQHSPPPAPPSPNPIPPAPPGTLPPLPTPIGSGPVPPQGPTMPLPPQPVDWQVFGGG